MRLSQDNAAFAGVALTKSIERRPPSNCGGEAGEVTGRSSNLERAVKKRLGA
jgi:hypothetical protein